MYTRKVRALLAALGDVLRASEVRLGGGIETRIGFRLIILYPRVFRTFSMVI
jgi:hypothetical protein